MVTKFFVVAMHSSLPKERFSCCSEDRARSTFLKGKPVLGQVEETFTSILLDIELYEYNCFS